MNLYQEVYVSPADRLEEREVGVVAIISQNQLSCAVAFPDKPGWLDTSEGFMTYGNGLIMLFNREATNRLWQDVATDKKFLISNIPNDTRATTAA